MNIYQSQNEDILLIYFMSSLASKEREMKQNRMKRPRDRGYKFNVQLVLLFMCQLYSNPYAMCYAYIILLT